MMGSNAAEVTFPASLERKHAAANFVVAVLGVYLLLSPVWYPSVAPRMYDNARVLELALLGLLSLPLLLPAFAAHAAALWSALPRTAKIAVAVFLVGGAASAALSQAPHIGALHLAVTAQLLVSSLVTATAVSILREQAERALAAAVTAGALAITLKFWITYGLYFMEGKTFSWISPFLDFANVRFFGQYQAYVLILFILPATLLPLSRIPRLLVYGLGAGFWSLQWMVGSRAVWVGFIVALLAVTAIWRGDRKRWVMEQIAVALVGGALYWLFSATMLQAPQATPIPPHNQILARSGGSDTERLRLLSGAVDLIRKHPVLGVGPGQFGLHYSETRGAHPHNTPMQLLSEYGLVAGTAGLLLGCLAVIHAFRGLRRPTSMDPVNASLAAALLMGLTDSVFSGNLTMPHSQILCATVLAWLFARGSSPVNVPAPQQRLDVWRTALMAVGLAATAATVVLSLEYLQVIREMPYPPQMRAPNFWQYGRFTAW